MSRTIFVVTKDVTRTIQPIKGCKPDEKDVDELTGGLKFGIIPEAGSPVSNTVGGLELQADMTKQKHVQGHSSGIVVMKILNRFEL